jgi:DHA3 family tetracycline resistance protein-like MFS transporter
LFRRDPYRVFIAFSGLSTFAFTLVATVNLVYQIEIVRLSPFQLLMVGSALELTCLVLQVPSGVLADAWSRRATVVLGVGLTGLGFIVEGAVPSFPSVLLAQVVWGSGASLVDGADSAWLVDEIGDERAAGAFLRSSQVSSAFLLLAIPASAGLAAVRLNLPVLLGGAMYVLLAGYLWAAMTERGDRSRGGRDHPVVEEDDLPPLTPRRMRGVVSGAARVVRSQPVVLGIVVASLFAGAASEGLDRLAYLHLIRDVGLPRLGFPPVLWFGVAGMGGAVIAIAVGEVLRRRDLAREGASPAVIVVLAATVAAGTLAFAAAGGFAVAIAFLWLIRAARRCWGPVENAWINRRIDSSVRATVLSINGLADAMGQIVAGPLIGLIASLVSVRAGISASAAFLVPAVAVFCALLVRERRRRPAGRVGDMVR